MIDLRTALSRVGRACLAAWLLTSAGCDGGGRFGLLSFELAAPPGECGPTNMPTIGTGTLMPCTMVRVYHRRPDGSRGPLVRLFRAGADPESAQGAEELRFDSAQISFDAMLPEGEHDLEIVVFTGSGWDATYGATVERVRLDEQEIRVRLYPFRQWACPGWRADGSMATRALHQAVPLANGDVLLLGGITGEGMDPASAGRSGRVGALLQPIVEVYEHDEHRFRQVTMVDGAVFARVLFGTIYLGEEAPDRHRIRVLGGLTLPEGRIGTAVLGFDNSGVLTALGAPFEPTSDAVAAPAVDLIYDAAARTLAVDTSPTGVPTGATQGAAIVVSSERPSDGSRAILMGLARGAEGWRPIAEYYPTDPIGFRMLAHPRLGATVDAIPSADRFLVWGGNVSTTPMVLEAAGELLQPTDPASAMPISSADGSLPPPVAFHTATRLGEDVLVVAGGLRIETTGNLLATPPLPGDSLFALQVGSAGTLTRHPVNVPATMMYTPTILHTATYVEGFGVVLVGGAAVVASDRLQPFSTAALVRGGVGTFELDDTLQDLAQPRFGHAATLLPGQRLLVTGGIAREGNTLRAIAAPELMYFARERYASIPAGQCSDQAVVRDDAGVDGGTPIPDAGPPDSGLPMSDSGVPLPDGGV